MYQIYTLVDPRNNLIHYVGISKNAQNRYQEHIGRDHGCRKSAWIRELKEAKFLPIMHIIAENLTSEEAQKQELDLIREYYNAGLPLVNTIGIHTKYVNVRMEHRKYQKRLRKWPSPVTKVQIITAQIVTTQIVKPIFEEYLTAKEVSERTGIPMKEVVTLTQKGIFKGFNAGSRGNWCDWRITQESLRRYIEERESQDGN